MLGSDRSDRSSFIFVQLGKLSAHRGNFFPTLFNNADAHLKHKVMEREVVVAVTNGKLGLGPWEQIFSGEFDGMRRKRMLVKVIG